MSKTNQNKFKVGDVVRVVEADWQDERDSRCTCNLYITDVMKEYAKQGLISTITRSTSNPSGEHARYKIKDGAGWSYCDETLELVDEKLREEVDFWTEVKSFG